MLTSFDAVQLDGDVKYFLKKKSAESGPRPLWPLTCHGDDNCQSVVVGDTSFEELKLQVTALAVLAPRGIVCCGVHVLGMREARVWALSDSLAASCFSRFGGMRRRTRASGADRRCTTSKREKNKRKAKPTPASTPTRPPNLRPPRRCSALSDQRQLADCRSSSSRVRLCAGRRFPVSKAAC